MFYIFINLGTTKEMGNGKDTFEHCVNSLVVTGSIEGIVTKVTHMEGGGGQFNSFMTLFYILDYEPKGQKEVRIK